MTDFVLVENLAQINRSLARSGPLVYKAMKKGLIEASEPVRQDAERLSRSEISGMKRAKRKPPPWSIQKLGQTVHGTYMVPRQRGKRFHRTDGDRSRAEKFVRMMYGKAYEPALARNQTLVRTSVDVWLNRVIKEI